MSTHWIPKTAVDVLHKNPKIYRPLRAVRWWAGRTLGARKLDGVPKRVHFNDLMLKSSRPEDVRAYVQGAMKVVGILRSSLEACGKNISSLSSCLEIGSGYGRVIRHISQLMPPTNVYACDVMEEASRFCSREFGINFFSCSSLSDIRNADRFEFIYLISVFTHLDSAAIVEMWSHIVRMLKPGGVVVFTTHGKTSASQIARYGPPWAATGAALSEALSKNGYLYEKYKWYKENIGMTWMTEDFLRSLLNQAPECRQMVRFCKFEPGIAGDQDVYTYQKL